MELFDNLWLGLLSAATPSNLLYCLIGCILGTVIGVLPGLGPVATISMLLPATFTLEPTASLIMLAGIYYGAQYGGSTTAILVNLPGEASSVVTCLDGYQMARQGRAGIALATAAISSFVAGTFATLVIAILAPSLASLALSFGAADYFALMAVGLIASVVLAQGSLLKALAMIVLGLIVGVVGVDVTSGIHRLTFDRAELADGVGLVPVAMGLFGLAEIIANLENPEQRKALGAKIRGLIPRGADLAAIAAPTTRGTMLGTVLGVLPGGGALIASFAAYTLEKKLSRTPERFGAGAIEGVAAPEAANNAGAQTSFIPMLTLGLPSNAVMALMAGAMIIQGIQPGPSVMNDQPSLFWGLIVSMWIGNLMLLILNLPLIGIWVKLLSTPYRLLYPAILVFCAIGVFTLNNLVFDLYVMVAFGFLGYLLKKLGCEPAPLVLGMVLGPMVEQYLRRAMTLSRGDPMVFIERPISASLLVFGAVLLLLFASSSLRQARESVLKE